MIVKETRNLDDIKAVLCNPPIYDTITDDNSPLVDDFEPPIDSDHKYIAGYVDDKIIGVTVYHSYLDGNKVHFQVLPEYRKDYAIEFGEQAIKFKGTLPLYAEIPDLYQNVLSFAFVNGFKIIGVIENDYTKSGKTYNVNVLEYN